MVLYLTGHITLYQYNIMTCSQSVKVSYRIKKPTVFLVLSWVQHVIAEIRNKEQAKSVNSTDDRVVNSTNELTCPCIH